MRASLFGGEHDKPYIVDNLDGGKEEAIGILNKTEYKCAVCGWSLQNYDEFFLRCLWYGLSGHKIGKTGMLGWQRVAICAYCNYAPEGPGQEFDVW